MEACNILPKWARESWASVCVCMSYTIDAYSVAIFFRCVRLHWLFQMLTVERPLLDIWSKCVRERIKTLFPHSMVLNKMNLWGSMMRPNNKVNLFEWGRMRKKTKTKHDTHRKKLCLYIVQLYDINHGDINPIFVSVFVFIAISLARTHKSEHVFLFFALCRCCCCLLFIWLNLWFLNPFSVFVLSFARKWK